MMLGAQFQVHVVNNLRVLRDEKNAYNGGSMSNSSGFLSIQLGFERSLRLQCNRVKKSIFISCKSSSGSPFDDGRSTNIPDDHDHDFLQASLLISETALHYRMRRQGFQEETTWRLPGRWSPFSAMIRESRRDTSFVGYEFLRRFQSPTIFLKVSCDGDFLLPIIVGEFAIEKLIDALRGGDGNDDGDCPDQFQLVRNLVDRLGYEPGENEVVSIDARPSDAINMAHRCKAPIHVSKQIVFTDAIRISYGMGRVHDRKPTYDVTLDSAADGPDSLAEELELVRNMNSAVKEERFNDAAMWRDKLMQLRQSMHDH
ncbi:bifunctional nuclease 2 isoform X2 [Ricinus communis]|uniref:bifunctional nuclease 2 isoform X2 n=1 Tax=Ricinus communis TaxID=3988 RepID=UPI00201AE2B7|nr:bifunctional nuclease 2 isoform X2 [Ricinus communis]